MNFLDLLNYAPPNSEIQSALAKINERIKDRPESWKAMCAISGGADSDVMLDMVWHVDDTKQVDYVWFDTGIEYEATKQHLLDLENKYSIKIVHAKAIKSIPACCKEYGLPFLSKRVSDYIERLQRHDFQWEDEPYETLSKRYTKCESALKWWCNANPKSPTGKPSRFNIDRNYLLKEFMVAHPPTFKISTKCCHYAKKMVAEQYLKNGHYDMNLIGLRQAENGIRSQVYHNCFTTSAESGKPYDTFRPLWWLTDEDRKEYEEHCNITHSDCYTIYGLHRTGCAGCPFSSNFEDELLVIQAHEPKLYKLCLSVFGKSYEYYRAYRQFKAKHSNIKQESNTI